MSPGPLDVGPLPAPVADRGVPRPGTREVRAGRHEGLLVVPSAAVDGPVPLLVFFHGSGGTAQQSLGLLGDAGERSGAAVLALRSTDHTWDVVVGRPGPDVAAVRRAFAEVTAVLDVDSSSVCFGGFSDGASYALTLGLANPETVQAVTAFSPGFVVDGMPAPGPRCFVSHGTADPVLPIDRTSRRIVPLLRGDGIEVEYLEFEGRHEVPAAAVERAFGWWLGPRGSA